MKFAEKLLNLRTQGGYSQELLAEKINVSRQAVSKWEQGTTLPETDKLIALSDFFHVSIDYLLRDNGDLNSDLNLAQIVIKFLASAQNMDGISKELIEIMKDGIIDDEEKIKMKSIIETLDTLSLTIEEIKRKMKLQLRRDGEVNR